MSDSTLNSFLHRLGHVDREFRRRPELRTTAPAEEAVDDLVELVPFVPADDFDRFCGLLESAIAERGEAPLGVLVRGREIEPWTDESEVELAAILRAARERREHGETAGALDQLRTEVLRRHPEGRAVFKPQVTPRDDGNFDVRVGHVNLVMGFDPTAMRRP